MKECKSVRYLFETSWEVCNKIGGIYTVLSSKAKTLKEVYKDRLIFIGPDVWSAENPSPYFTELVSLMRGWREKGLLPEGVSVRVGRWEVPGRPVAILVKFDSLYHSKNEFYGRLWELYGVDSLHAYGDYDEGAAFGRAAAAVIESIVEYTKTCPEDVIAHFDEWTTASGLLALKDALPGISTVFTTHATSIGRSICGNGKPLYGYLEGYNGNQMAEELNMQSKHSIERAAALAADEFTTVSDITATEGAQLLERRPAVTPNGFELNFVPEGAKYDTARKTARESLLGVARTLTGIDFDDDTFILATSGRCEYRNKGLDLFLDSLKAVEKGEGPGRRILAYVLVPAWCGGPRKDLEHALRSGSVMRLNDPVRTHEIVNNTDDAILARIHGLQFDNREDALVTVIYVPCYLNGTDGIFNKTYYELLPGVDGTVFASYYEPWGYTPLESIAFGVPTITTTLAGFGQWILDTSVPEFGASGVKVVRRTDDNYAEACSEIACDIRELAEMPASMALDARQAARDEARKFEWSKFMEYYYKAYDAALRAASDRTKK